MKAIWFLDNKQTLETEFPPSGDKIELSNQMDSDSWYILLEGVSR
jgi:hypothetical protein